MAANSEAGSRAVVSANSAKDDRRGIRGLGTKNGMRTVRNQKHATRIGQAFFDHAPETALAGKGVPRGRIPTLNRK